jgi:hypothetical protein
VYKLLAENWVKNSFEKQNHRWRTRTYHGDIEAKEKYEGKLQKEIALYHASLP